MYCNKILRFFLFILILNVFHVVKAQQNENFWGGGLSVLVPDNGFLKFKQDFNNFGFATAANTGFGANFTGMHFFRSGISLGSELGYSYFPKDNITWNMQDEGAINVNYQIGNLSLMGDVYFSESDIRPFCGAVFGLYYLHNVMDFDSRYAGTDDDASVEYKTNDFLMGFGLQAGVLMKVEKRKYLSFSLRYTVIPDLESKYYEDEGVMVNPQDKENHWSISVKLFWRKR